MSECGCVELMWRGGERADADPGTKLLVTKIYRTLDGQAKSRLHYNTSRPPSVLDAATRSLDLDLLFPFLHPSVSLLPIDRDGASQTDRQTSTRVLVALP